MNRFKLITALLIAVSLKAFSQNYGISESSVILNINNAGSTFFDLQATTANPDFHELNLGVFNSNQSLVLAGAQQKTYKCNGCGIASSTLFYRVYPVYSLPGNFSTVNIPFLSNDAGGCGGNQTWQLNTGTTNIISDLNSGVYYLEVYTSAAFSNCGSGTIVADNNGQYYRAKFTVNGIIAQYAGTTVSATKTALSTSNSLVTTSNGTISNQCTSPLNIMRVSAGAFNQTTPTHYLQLTVKPLSGYQFTISSIKINSRKMPGGPANGRIDYNPNNTGFVTGNIFTTSTTSTTCTSTVPEQAVYPANVTITDTSNGVVIRVYYWVNTLANGALDFSNISVEGIVSEVNGVPKLALPSVASITQNSAVLGATVISGSGSALSARGTVYNTTGGVSATNNPLNDGSTNIGTFTHLRNGLNAETRYYFAGFATNTSGTGLTSESSFYTRSKAPLSAASGLTATPVTFSSVALAWNNASFPANGATKYGYMVIASTGTPSIIASPSGLPPASVISNGTLSAIIESSSPALPPATATATGLSGNTLYNFAVIPFTWNGVNTETYNYNTNNIPIASATTPRTKYTWANAGSGSWNIASNWLPSGVPASMDGVIFNTSGTFNISNVPDATLSSISVQGNANVTLTPAATGGDRTITLNGSNALLVETGSTLNINGNGNNNLNINFTGTGNSSIINGILNLKATTGSAGNYNSTNCITTVNGIISTESAATITATPANLLITAAGKFQLTGSGLNIPTATWQTGSTCEIAVTNGGILNGLGQSFSNFIVNCPNLQNDIQCNGNLTLVNDNFSIINTNYAAGKKFSLTNTTAFTLNLYGDVSISNNACLDITSGIPYTSGIATLNLYNNLTISGNGVLNQTGSSEAFINFNKLTGNQVITLASANSISQNDFAATISIGNGSTSNQVILASDFSLGNYYISNLIVNNGATFDPANYVVSGLGGNIDVLPGSVLRIGHQNGINLYAMSGNIQLSGTRNFSSGATYNYCGTTNQVTGDGLPVSANAIIIENTGITGNNTVSFSDNDSVASITLVSGQLNPNNHTITVKQNGIISARGGDFNPLSTGKVAFNNGFVSGSLNFYPDVLINGAVDFGSNSTIYGELEISNNGAVAANPPAYAIGSILKYSASGNFLRGLEWSSLSGNGYPYNVEVSNATSLDLFTNGQDIRECGGSLTITPLSAVNMGNMNYPLIVGKDAIVEGTLVLSNSTNTNGNFKVSGNLTINSSGNIITNNRLIILQGAIPTLISGTAASMSFDYMEISKAPGNSVSLARDITLQKGLTLTSGIISTGANKIIIPQSSGVNRTSGHVNGNLMRYINTGTSITRNFDVGDSVNYAPVSVKLNNVTAAGYLTVSTLAGDHPGIGSTTFYNAKTVNRYYRITNSGVAFGFSSPTFYFDPADIDPNSIVDSMVCARLENNVWSYPNTGLKTATSIKVLSINSFGEFQLGTNCTSPVLNKVSTAVSCRNGNNGSIQLNENGGAPPFSYIWSNGATNQSISNLTAGTYTVTVTGQGGCSSTASAVVTQPATAVTASAVNNSPICAGSNLAFTGNASGGTGTISYYWQGPAGFTSTQKNPTITSANDTSSGNYILIVTDANNCTATYSTLATVNAVYPAISGSTLFCAGSSTVLNAGTYSSYLWSNGASTSSITVNTSNTYTVTVTSSNGCTGSKSVTVTAVPVLTPTASISASTGNSICINNPVTFTANIINGGIAPVYQWKKNNIVVGGNSSTYSDAALNQGDVIKCVVSCSCATQSPVTSNSITMTVSQPIPVSAGNGQLVICGTGTTTVYGKINNVSSGYSGTWSTTSGSGSFSSTNWNGINGVTYTAGNSDIGKTIYLVLTGPASGACAGVKDSIAIDVQPGVSLNIGSIGSLCYGAGSFIIPLNSILGSPATYTLMAASPNPMPGFTNHVSQPLYSNSISAVIPAGTASGTYNFTLQAFRPPCESQVYNIALTINPNPVININAAPATICQGSNSQLTATGASGYNWQPGNLDGNSAVVTPLTNTIYTVTGTSAFGCTSTATAAINVNALPTPVINGNTAICAGMSTMLNAGPGYISYLWSNGITNQTLFTSVTNTFTVTVTNTNNCTASASKSVNILPAITVAATTNRDSINAGDTIQLNATANGSVSGINYDVTPVTFAPLSGTGIKVNLGDDQVSNGLPIGFNFVFYGNTYNTFYISSNGFITFNAGSNDGCCQGPPLPNNNISNVSNLIALAWNDLTGAGGTIDYFTTGTAPNRKLVVRFNVQHINGDPVITQAILFEGSNQIEIHSTSIPNMLYADPSYISSMGVENNGATSASTVPGRNGAGWSATNDAWNFTPYATYNYTWTPASGLLNSNIKNPKAVPLSSTTYSVTATASNGCTGTATKYIYVNQPSALTAFSFAQPINCYGTTSSVTVSAVGGVPPYTGTGVFNVPAGNHSFTVTDATGSSTVTNITIAQPAQLVANCSASTINCYGQSATVTVNATGGSSPYLGTGNFTVTAGTYNYIVTDNKGCTAATNITVYQPAVLNSTANATPINCYGSSSVVTVNATGGTLPYSGTGSYTVNAGNYTYTITDAQGCTSSSSISITQPAQLAATSYGFTTICYGDSTIITVVASGGNPPYTGIGTYKVPAGTYTYIVSDNNGCTALTSITVNQLPQVMSTLNLLQNVNCYGQNNGKITVTGYNGAVPYTYAWSDGTTGKTLYSAAAGTYTVTITDNSGCSSAYAYTVTQPDDLLVTGSFTNISCNGGSNGTITPVYNGGVTPYTYLWNTGAVTSSINNLASGTYKVTVTDANGCTAMGTYILTQPTLLTSTGYANNANCFGESNGSTGVTPSGGTTPYSYLWSNGATTGNLVSIPANNYTVTITDANGCTLIKNYTVSEPAALTATCNPTSATCFGDNNGKATVNASGGSIPYDYMWNNGATTKTIYSLQAGTYTVTVTDNHGCTVNSNVTITQPQLLMANCTGTGVNCNGGSNGNASVSAIGGNGVYSFQWNNGATTNSISNLLAGNYTVTVTDTNLCKATASYTVSQPSALSSSVTSVNITCNGLSNGSVSLATSGGTGPYTYIWITGNTTNTINNLGPGNYTATITDNKGCSIIRSATISQPAVLSNTNSKVDILCYGNSNGSITSNPSGGTSPYAYSWSTGVTTKSIYSVPAGTYTVTVTDNKGCTKSTSTVITQPNALSTTLTSVNVSCNGFNNGSATISASGGTTPYSYLWTSGATSSSISMLSPATYTVTVTDNNGCTSTKSSIITEPAILTLNNSIINLTCNGSGDGKLTANPAGGSTPYNYQWSNAATTKINSNLSAGSYTVTVTDNRGCTKTASSLVTQPTAVAITSTVVNVSCNGGSNGSIQNTPSGGTSPYTYLWNGGNTSSSRTSLAAGNYTITVTDFNGCTKKNTYSITQPAALSVSITKTNPTGGNSNGSASASVSGGTSPYNYSWSTSPVRTTATITGLSSGTYSVTVTDNNGCTKVSSTTLVSSRLASDFDNNSTEILELIAYPNPSNGEFKVQINATNELYSSIIISDALTQIVYNKNEILNPGLNELTINLSQPSKGIYYLSVQTDASIHNIPIIIQ